jgi:ribosome-associated protein
MIKESMNIESLKELVIDALEDMKAKDIAVLDVRDLSNVTDVMIIATGTSNRQVKSLANHIVEKAKQNGVMPLGTEGENTADWVLVDLGDVVCHIMQESVREFYQLERLWSTPPIDEDDAETNNAPALRRIK